MQRIELAELRRDSEAFDALAQETPYIDHYCTSSPWALSAHEAFHPEQELFLFRSDSAWLTLARATADRKLAVEPGRIAAGWEMYSFTARRIEWLKPSVLSKFHT